MDKIKEVFIVSVAERVDIHYNGEASEDWFSERTNEIRDKVDELGLDSEFIVDMDIVDDDTVQVYILTGSHIEVGDEKDFRGYVLHKGDTIIPDHDIISSMRDANSYGEYGFEEGEYFEIIEVRHDDINSRIEYYLKCYVEAVKPASIDID